MVTFLDGEGNAASTEPFAEGWMNENGVYLGRPIDVQQYVDGSILVSDDKAWCDLSHLLQRQLSV